MFAGKHPHRCRVRATTRTSRRQAGAVDQSHQQQMMSHYAPILSLVQ